MNIYINKSPHDTLCGMIEGNCSDENSNLQILKTGKGNICAIYFSSNGIFFPNTPDSFEETIRNAISIGGDTDTIAAIVGSISEGYYGIPKDIKAKIKPYLKDYMYDLLKDRNLFIEEDRYYPIQQYDAEKADRPHKTVCNA